MKHRKKIISVIASVMLLACLVVMPVAAQPPIPCFIIGAVTVDGAACPGSTVLAKVDGAVVGTATVAADSNYAMAIAQIDGVPAEGAALAFYVDDNLATTTGDAATWKAGGQKTINLAAGGAVTYTLDMAVSPVGVGTTTPAIGQHVYAAGTNVQLTATLAVVGSQFDYWVINGATVTANPTWITMNSVTTATAYFVPLAPPTPGEGFAYELYETFIEPLID